jgi:alkane 1-monooxygenase
MSSLKKLGFFFAFILPVVTVIGYYLGGWYNYATVFLAYVLMPMLDLVVGKDPHNVDESQIAELSEQRYYRFITYAWTYVQVGIVAWGAYVFARGSMQLYEQIGFLLSLSNVTGGIGITVAHELGHRQTKIEQFYAKVILMTVSYMHFYIEHNRGHHVWVATPKDPATSRKGESIYGFYFRTVVGSFLSAWEIERSRLHKKGVSAWSLQNEMIQYQLITLGFCLALMLGCSLVAGQILWAVPVFFVLQSIMAFSLLEAVNYIEHYGIVRKEIAEGRYERVNPTHSWNTNQLVTNFFLFQLQRHSDHHANANRRYQVLRHFDISPQLPFGYPTMISIALFPPLWFKLMDNRLENWKKEAGIV